MKFSELDRGDVFGEPWCRCVKLSADSYVDEVGCKIELVQEYETVCLDGERASFCDIENDTVFRTVEGSHVKLNDDTSIDFDGDIQKWKPDDDVICTMM